MPASCAHFLRRRLRSWESFFFSSRVWLAAQPIVGAENGERMRLQVSLYVTRRVVRRFLRVDRRSVDPGPGENAKRPATCLLKRATKNNSKNPSRTGFLEIRDIEARAARQQAQRSAHWSENAYD